MSENERISQLKNTITTTASALFSKDSLEQSILSNNSPYRKILRSTIKNLDSGDSIVRVRHYQPDSRNGHSHDAYTRRSGDDYFKNDFTNSKTGFKVMTYLNDDMLNETNNEFGKQQKQRLLPSSDENEKHYASLFQGFEASLPIVNKALEQQGSQGNLTDRNEESKQDLGFIINILHGLSDFTVDNVVDTDRISRSYSLKYLKGLSEELVRNLNLTLIQKDVTSDEIGDLDTQMKELKKKQDLFTERMEKAEQNELFLESTLSLIKDRISFIQEYDLEVENNTNESSVNNSVNNDDVSFTEESNTGNIHTRISKSKNKNIQLSESVYSKLKSKHGVTSNRLQMFYREANRKSKKPVNSLQNRYDPGTNIMSIEHAHENGIACLDFDVPFGTLCSAGYLDQTVKIWNLTRKVQVAELNGHRASVNCMQIGSHYNLLITGGRDAVLKLWDINLATQVYQEETSSLEDQQTSCIHTFVSHTDEITALSFDTLNLVSGSQDKTIRQWDLLTGQCIQTIDLSSIVKANAFASISMSSSTIVSSDPPIVGSVQCFDAALATGTKDGIVRLWDLRVGKVIREIEGHTNSVTSLKFDSFNLISGSLDKSVRIWDLRTGALSNAYAYDSPVHSIDFDQNNIVSAVGEDNFKIYNRKSDHQWTCGKIEKSTGSPINHIKYKYNYVVEGKEDGAINAWRV